MLKWEKKHPKHYSEEFSSKKFRKNSKLMLMTSLKSFYFLKNPFIANLLVAGKK